MLEEYNSIDRKGFDEYDVRTSLSAIRDESNPDWKHEWLAWSLRFSADANVWGTHYGPVSLIDENGNRVDNPPQSAITPDAVLYWCNRYPTLQNPLLLERYCGLVWDFCTLLPDQRKPADLYEKYVTSLLDVVRGEYLEHKVYGTYYLKRAAGLVQSNPTKLDEWKSVLHDFVASENIDSTSIGIWGVEVNIIIEHKNLFSDSEKQTAIGLLLQRYAYFSTKNEFYILKDVIDIMFAYYVRHGLKDKARNFLYDFEQNLSANTSLDALKKEHYYELLAGQYRQIGCKPDEQRVLAAMHTAANESVKYLQKVEIPMEITKEQWESWMNNMTKGEPEEQIEWFLLYFIPNLDKSEKELEKLAKAFPFRYGVSTKLHLGDMPGSVIRPYDLDKEGNLIFHITQQMQISDALLVQLLRRLMETKVLSQNVLELQIQQSVLIQKYRKSALSHIIQLFFDGNYVAFCHQIVPQIEAMIRTLLQELGLNVLKIQRSGYGFQLKTLDELLHEPAINEVFSGNAEDKSVSTYLRIILTDQRGRNYRNLICHGVISPNLLTENVAGRLLHVFMLLLRVQRVQ